MYLKYFELIKSKHRRWEGGRGGGKNYKQNKYEMGM